MSRLKIIKKDDAEETFLTLKTYEPLKKIDIVCLFSNDKLPIEYKYAALQVYSLFH